MARVGNRSPADGGRPHSVVVTFSDMEMAQVAAAAAREGLTRTSWLGDAGVAAATSGRGPASSWGEVMQQLMGLRAELMDARRLARNIGGNLNDVARAVNASGDVPVAARRVLELVERVVKRLDSAVAGVDEATASARRERLRGSS